jgi:hypothetical protein
VPFVENASVDPSAVTPRTSREGMKELRKSSNPALGPIVAMWRMPSASQR